MIWQCAPELVNRKETTNWRIFSSALCCPAFFSCAPVWTFLSPYHKQIILRHKQFALERCRLIDFRLFDLHPLSISSGTGFHPVTPAGW
jgi:hypothetical protein